VRFKYKQYTLRVYRYTEYTLLPTISSLKIDDKLDGKTVLFVY